MTAGPFQRVDYLFSLWNRANVIDLRQKECLAPCAGSSLLPFLWIDLGWDEVFDEQRFGQVKSGLS
jgi:hypothetical protein